MVASSSIFVLFWVWFSAVRVISEMTCVLHNEKHNYQLHRAQESTEAQVPKRNAEQAATRIAEDRDLPGAFPDSAVALG